MQLPEESKVATPEAKLIVPTVVPLAAAVVAPVTFPEILKVVEEVNDPVAAEFPVTAMLFPVTVTTPERSPVTPAAPVPAAIVVPPETFPVTVTPLPVRVEPETVPATTTPLVAAVKVAPSRLALTSIADASIVPV